MIGMNVVLFDAPTGVINTYCRDSTAKHFDARANYICVMKTLQDQFLKDDYSRVIKGRSNYPVGMSVDAGQFMNLTAEESYRTGCKAVWQITSSTAGRSAGAVGAAMA